MQSILERELRIQILEDCKINYKKAAKNLLYAIEANGMQPPFSDKVFQKNCKKLQEPHGNEWDAE